MEVTLHVPIMVSEVLTFLRANEGGTFLDCTLGGAGHTKALLDANKENWVVSIDRDLSAVERAKKELAGYSDRFEAHHAAFSNIPAVAQFAKFDGILADLGVSTDQLRSGRGFSFKDKNALDMRMDQTKGQTADEFINTADKTEIFRALVRGGVKGDARAVADLISRERPISSAEHLADLIANSRFGKHSKSGVHPATVIFQAIRMAVNSELSEIEALLDIAPGLMKPKGRLAVLTFHSIEDREVTGRMRSWEAAGTYPASWRGEREGERIGTVLTRKATTPSEEEIERNPASRSARLRVFEFLK